MMAMANVKYAVSHSMVQFKPSTDSPRHAHGTEHHDDYR